MTLAPQFPHVPASAGHYESFYFTAHHRSEPVAVWIRYTVHKRPGEASTASIWFTLFEPGGPTAVKVTTDDPRADAGQLLAVGGYGAVRADGADGAITSTGTGVDASWDVRFDPCAPELRHLPYGWMYRAGIPRTKSTSPYPSMRVSGSVTVAGRRLDLDGWRGMLGHNWGSEHAHRWIWLRGASFAEQPDAWLDVVIGRIKVGPFVTPWIANGALALNGAHGTDDTVRHRVGGFGHRVAVTERADGCDLVLPGREVSLTVHVTAPIAASVGWEYADPAGGRHQVRNCSAAAVRVAIRRRGVAQTRLVTAHGGVYELGSAEFDPSVLVQPYPDG
ncbi:MAG TPA: hypothetical protein VGH01_07015 [Jatrophihabitantaceae bacterium]